MWRRMYDAHAPTCLENCVNIQAMPKGVRRTFDLRTFAPSKSLIFGHF